MSIPTPTPDEPTPEDIARGLAQVDRFLTEQAPPPPPPASADPVEPEPVVTGRVRRLADEVAEARALVALQGDDTPLLVDTDRVRKRRKAAAQARQLHQLGQDPAARAWQAARWRLVLTATALIALILALGWSTAGVQVFAADGAASGTPGWLFAWFVEPFMSLALLTVVAARAFMATRGQPLDDPTLRRIEGLFLALTVGMNAWPHLPLVAHPFTVSRLVLHILGPIVAVAIVTALPPIWRAFAELDHGPMPTPATVPYPAPTGPKYSTNTTTATPNTGGATGVLVARARRLIQAGDLPADPSATRLREALRCGTDTARQIRDALKNEGPAPV
jgi:hypothetical protein